MILGVVNSKGGVGKSTVTVHLAAWLHKAGKSVILVDSDVQGSSSRWLSETSLGIPTHRLVTPDEVLETLPGLAKQADYVVVDGPAGLSELTRTIMLTVDRVLMPCGPSVLDVRAADDAIRTLRQAQLIRKGAPSAVFVPNKVQALTRLSRELLDAAEKFGIGVSPPIGLRQAFPKAAGQGALVWDLGREAWAANAEIKKLMRSLKL